MASYSATTLSFCPKKILPPEGCKPSLVLEILHHYHYCGAFSSLPALPLVASYTLLEGIYNFEIHCCRLAQLPVRDKDISRTRLPCFLTQAGSGFELCTKACMPE